MPRVRAAALLLAAALAGCTPTLNWRELRAAPGTLQVLLPCKPDAGSRRVAMGGREVELHALGCEAGGATFAVFQAELGPAAGADVLDQWNRATLSHLQGRAEATRPFQPPGAASAPGSVRVAMRGRRPDGTDVQGEAAYFTQGGRMYQAVVYAAPLRPEQTQPFFDGLRFP